MDERELKRFEKKHMKKMEEFASKEMNVLDTAKLFINFKGIWDMEGLFKLIAEFYTVNKYKFFERLQRHRHPGPFGAERMYKFDGIRRVDQYHTWNLYIVVETFDEHEVEVVSRDGRRRMMTKGRLWIQVWGEVKVDYEKKWENSYLALTVRDFLHKYVIVKRIELPMWDKMYYTTVVRLHDNIARFLKIESAASENRYMGGVH